MGLRILVQSVIVLLLSLNVLAASLEVVKVNDFDVHLIDVENGNEVSIQYLVPVGSRFDPTPMAGRAHFLEHMVGKGSLRYPGYHTMTTLTSQMNARKNASTGLSWTNYYMIVNNAYLEKAIDLLFAGLAGPEFKSEVLKKELTAVDNEVNVEIPSKPLFNLFYSNADFLPDDHPYQRWDLGTSDILDNMTVDDLKGLFYANYQPEFIKITIAANFSGGDIKKEEVIAYLQKSLQAPSVDRDPHGYQLTEAPIASQRLAPMFDHNSPAPFIEYKSEDSTIMGVHIMESKSSRSRIDALALRLLEGYLNLDVPGSLYRSLKDKGWVTSFGAGDNHISDRAGQYIVFRFTEEGWKNRSQAILAFYETLADIKQNGIDPYTLEVIKGLFLDEQKENFKSADNAMNAIRDLFELKDKDLLALDFKKALARIQPSDFKALIKKMYDPQLTATAYLSPDVEAQAMSPHFKKPFRKYENKKLIQALSAKLASKKPTKKYRPQFPKVEEFKQRAQPLALNKSDWVKTSDHETNITTYFKEDHSKTEGAFYLATTLNHLESVERQVALQIYLESFKESTRDTFTVLRSRGIFLSGSIQGDSLIWTGEGEAQSLAQAFTLVSEMFKNYQPTNQELSSSLVRYRSAIRQSINSSFIGSLARSYAVSEFSFQPNAEKILEVTQLMDANSIFREIKDIQITGRPHLFVVGDHTTDEASSYITSTWNVLSFAFANIKTEAEPPGKLLIESGKKIFQLPPGKDLNSVGVARLYQGPKRSNLKENAISIVLGAYLHTAVFNLNRSEKGLGYVHGAGIPSVGPYKDLLFYGQADSYEKALEAVKGWEEVVTQLRNREVENTVWEEYKTGAINSLLSKPTSYLEEAQRVGANFRLALNPNQEIELVEMIKAISPKDIYSFIDTYLSPNQAYYDFEVKNCNDVLK